MNCECPQCGSKAFKRNGYTRHGKQNHRCLDCGRQFSLEPLYTESQTHPIDFMSEILSERTVELEGIC